MPETKDIVVVKYGSECVVNQFDIRQSELDHYATQIDRLSQHYDVIVVSSGAIAVGRTIINRNRRDNPDIEDTVSLQSLATVGSAGMHIAWQRAFLRRNLIPGQISVTHHDIKIAEKNRDDEGKTQVKSETNRLEAVLRNNIASRIISIVNENDALSDEEITMWKYGGDNDGLARHIAQLFRAKHLCLMTAGVDGILDENKKAIPLILEGNIYKLDHWIDDTATTSLGRGGMRSKADQALQAARCGVEAHIANANADLLDVVNRRTGTTFPAQFKLPRYGHLV